ncbi:hypothetical protein [Haliscomenobacter sp.]|uniref:hypothetical protein n=1 Tax=Haliscomenobacter sp. TaxID=2717303 RepID=UPI003593A4F9
MTAKQIREKIQSHLGKGEVEECLSTLLSALGNTPRRRERDNALMLKAKWEGLKQEQLRGILSREEYEVAFNKIISGIQAVINDIDHDPENILYSPQKFDFKGIYFVVGILLIAVLFSGYYFVKIANSNAKESNIEPLDTLDKSNEGGVAKGKDSIHSNTTEQNNHTTEKKKKEPTTNSTERKDDKVPETNDSDEERSIDKPEPPPVQPESKEKNYTQIINIPKGIKVWFDYNGEYIEAQVQGEKQVFNIPQSLFLKNPLVTVVFEKEGVTDNSKREVQKLRQITLPDKFK